MLRCTCGAGATRRRKRQRGAIDELPSGALRVRVHVGRDPISKRRMDLIEVVPAGPHAGDQAEKVRTRLLSQVDEGETPVRARRSASCSIGGWNSGRRPVHEARLRVQDRQAYPTVARIGAANPARRRDPRLVLRRAAPLPRPLRPSATHSAPHQPRAPVRRASRGAVHAGEPRWLPGLRAGVQAACLPWTVGLDCTARCTGS